MTEHTLLVCSLCRFSENQNKKNGLSGGQYLIEELQKGLESCDLSARLEIKPVSCMAACSRSCAATLAAADKLTFIFNQLSPLESTPDLLQFVKQYITSPRANAYVS
jgi:predicted metal-binding protein